MYPTTNIQEDATVNTFHVVHADSNPNWSGLADAWDVFMSGNHTFYPDTVRQNDHTIKAYDLASPEPRAPVYEGTWSFTTAPTGETLPPEIALCVSFEGARVSGQDQARRRGRLYMGPFDDVHSVNGRPSTAVVDQLVVTFGGFIEDINLLGFTFVVWSTVNQSATSVARVWADNEWDVQRRRGWERTYQESLPIVQTIP